MISNQKQKHIAKCYYCKFSEIYVERSFYEKHLSPNDKQNKKCHSKRV